MAHALHPVVWDMLSTAGLRAVMPDSATHLEVHADLCRFYHLQNRTWTQVPTNQPTPS